MTIDELIEKAAFAAHIASATPGMSDFIRDDPSCVTMSPDVGLEMSTTMIRAAIFAIEEAGMVIVPVNPTNLMKIEGARRLPVPQKDRIKDFAHDIYAEMLAASPIQPTTQEAT